MENQIETLTRPAKCFLCGTRHTNYDIMVRRKLSEFESHVLCCVTCDEIASLMAANSSAQISNGFHRRMFRYSDHDITDYIPRPVAFRGSEIRHHARNIIKILELRGGVNKHKWTGKDDQAYYFISPENFEIRCQKASDIPENYILNDITEIMI